MVRGGGGKRQLSPTWLRPKLPKQKWVAGGGAAVFYCQLRWSGVSGGKRWAGGQPQVVDCQCGRQRGAAQPGGAAGRRGRCGGRQRRSGGVGRRPPFTRGRRLRPYQFRLLGPLDTVPWPVVPGRVPGRAPSDRPQPAAPWLQSRSTTLSTIWSEPSRPMPPHLTPGSVVTSPISPPSPALFGLWRAPCRIRSCSARAPRRGLQVGHQFSSPFLLRPPLSGGQHCLHRHCAGDAALVGPGRRNAAP